MKPLRLGLVLFPGCMPAGLFAAADLVRACSLRAARDLVTTTWVALEGSAVPVGQGPALKPQATIDEAACDAWLLPGLWLSSPAELGPCLERHRRLVDRLRALPRRAPVWSYCAGVALAAAAGRLDGQDATATWWLQPALAERFPRVRWQGLQQLVAADRAVTAAGPNGHLPLMLDRLAPVYSAPVLRDVQEVLMLPQPHARHAAFHPVDLMSLRDPLLRRLLVFAQRTPAQALGLAQAAAHVGLSQRTLSRHVKAASGLTAGDWLRRAKLHQAGEALRRTRAPLKTLCDELGFASEAGLHRAFRSTTGMTPSAYRQAYGERTALAE